MHRSHRFTADVHATIALLQRRRSRNVTSLQQAAPIKRHALETRAFENLRLLALE
jgi:hypothetical protein